MRPKQLSNCTGSQHHVLMTTKSKEKRWKRWEIVKNRMSNRTEMFVFGTQSQTRHSTVRKQASSIVTKLLRRRKHVTDAWLVWFFTFMTRVIAENIAMWEIQHSTVDWDYSKTQTVLVTVKTLNRPRERILCNTFHTILLHLKLFLRYKFAHGWFTRSSSLGFG